MGRRLLAMLFGFLLLVVLALWLVRRGQAQQGIPDSYQAADGTPIPVLISRTEIGIVPRSGVSLQDALASIAQFTLKQAQIPNSTLAILTLPEARDRQGLVQLTQAIAAQSRTRIAQVGLVIRKATGGGPFLAGTEIIVKLRAGSSASDLQALNQSVGAEIAMENPFVPGQYLLRLLPATNLDSLAAAQRYLMSGLVEYAFPNFINSARDLQPATTGLGPLIPNDEFFPRQWPHQNTGQAGSGQNSSGTEDADADTAEAWRITQGTSATIIAIIENGGFDLDHEDLMLNLWTNGAEISGNGIDDDVNGYIDDVHGWDFEACAESDKTCGHPVLTEASGDSHGTAVAGVAAAQSGNGVGIAGACPQCRWMPLRTGATVSTDWAKSLAVGYAERMGAQIISNSWEMDAAPNTLEAINTAATSGRAGRGTIVVFAAGNRVDDACEGNDLVKSSKTIAVSSSSNQDRKVVVSAVGACVAVLAPSHRGFNSGDPFKGTLNIPTTDLSGEAGYNQTDEIAECPSTEPSKRSYTLCFGGTSAAAPLVAGISGLVLTVRSSLTRDQLHRLLQDTADKIEPSVGQYSPITGRSEGFGMPTHAYGRVNAFEAVRIASPSAAAGGKDGIDVFLRDNTLDWGNTQQPSTTLFEPVRGNIPNGQSPDVKIDAPPFLTAAPANSGAFQSFNSEDPAAGQVNKVYVRVRNRGPDPANSVAVKLLWASVTGAMPDLPSDFWTVFPANPSTGAWKAAGDATVNVPYSGSSVAGGTQDAAPVVSFDLNLPTGLTGKISLLTILHAPPQDPVSMTEIRPEQLAAKDNNVTFHNATVR